MQQQLFETDGPANRQGLTIYKGQKHLLTKNQDAFNKLTQKIERLHKELEKKQLQFDTALKIYAGEIYPIECRLAAYERELVTILWEVYKSARLSKTNQRYLKAMLRDKIGDLCRSMEGGPDESLKKMYAEIEGESFETLRQRDKETMKTEIQDIFDELDMDIDLDKVDMNDENAMAEKIAEVQQKMQERQEEEQFARRKTNKKKTAKQAENERIQKAGEEIKQKNISTIYKQLAKLFHPDLERDETRRAEKEVLMKELTTAYEAKNLHSLLMLELKWIHKENDHLESLSEEKLAIYLQILKDQAKDLEREIQNMFQQPCYHILAEEFGPQVQRFPVEVVKDNLKTVKKAEADFKTDLKNCRSPHGHRFVKEMVEDWKESQHQDNVEEEFINMILNMHRF